NMWSGKLYKPANGGDYNHGGQPHQHVPLDGNIRLALVGHWDDFGNPNSSGKYRMYFDPNSSDPNSSDWQNALERLPSSPSMVNGQPWRNPFEIFRRLERLEPMDAKIDFTPPEFED